MTYDNERLLIERLAEINCSILNVSTMLHSVANSLYIMSERNRGQWRELSTHRDDEGDILRDYECSVCLGIIRDIPDPLTPTELPKFCCMCGAKMESEVLSDD